MTKEEAKKMGATHYDNIGNYYLSIKSGAANICYQFRDGEWQTPYSMFLNLKPL